MALTPDEQERIRVLSDTILYEKAQTFVNQHGTQDGQRQMHAIQEYAQSWYELKKFVTHQSSKDIDKYKSYYGALWTLLNQELRELVKRELDYTGRLSRAEKGHVRQFLEAVMQEFVQHLVAESLWQEKVKA